MLWKASGINGYAIAATNGRLGTISDFLFEDANWMVRWLVVDTGRWLSGRKVLLSPSVLGNPYPQGEEFSVRLTTEQVKASPNIDIDLPVSRQMETSIYDYYGWTPYVGSGLSMIAFGSSEGAETASLSTQFNQGISDSLRSDGDPHLRSTEAVTGYHIHAADGEIGHIEDFLIDDADWSIHYIIVNTKNWWPGRTVLISPRSAKKVDWNNRTVSLNIGRQRVKDSPAYDVSTTLDLAYEKQFHSYYGDDRPNSPL